MKTNLSKKPKNLGFALVATVLLMVLLTMLAVSFVTLSSISLRTSSRGMAQSEAQANARLALAIAIGELQKQMGPDQRISANSAITATTTVNNPHWTGVWDSWVAGAQSTTNVNANYPSAFDSAHQTIGDLQPPLLRPNYQRKDLHFRGWLLSLDEADITNIFAPAGPALTGNYQPQSTDNAVTLVGKGSLGETSLTTEHVGARLINVADATTGKVVGRYGWWVGDQSQKAMIMADSYETLPPATKAERLFRQEAPGSMGNTSITGFDQVTNHAELAKLASGGTLELVENVDRQDARLRFHDITTDSLGVLADVREGGLKRDLSTILERPIDPEEVYNPRYPGGPELGWRADSYKTGGEAFMLYEFDDERPSSLGSRGQAAVPIQDLAAYYQLYDGSRTEWNVDTPTKGKGGIQYSTSDSSPPNSLLNNGIMVSNPDYGLTNSPEDLANYLRQYTALYRNVVPVKIEVIFSFYAELRDPNEKADAIKYGYEEDPANPDEYVLKIGLSPAITFWNPNNVPLVMNLGDPEHSSLLMRHGAIPLEFQFTKSGSTSSPFVTQINEVPGTFGELFTLFVSGKSSAVFEPGQCKVFSLKSNANQSDMDFYLRGRGGANYRYNEPFVEGLELVPGWNQQAILRPTGHSNDPTAIRSYNIRKQMTVQAQEQDASGNLVFNPDGTPKMINKTIDVPLTFSTGDRVETEIVGGPGGGLALGCSQKSRHGRNLPGVQWHFRSYDMTTRISGASAFHSALTYMGFPWTGRGIKAPSDAATTITLPPRSELEDTIGDNALPSSFFYYSVRAGTETHDWTSAGTGSRFPSRPFLHSTPLQPPFFDSLDGMSLYNYGWNWFFKGLVNVSDAPISIASNNSGYFGGGYKASDGSTHVVQQQLPLTPPISIAALSHARLGGYSLAAEPPAEGYYGLQYPGTPTVNLVVSESFRRCTALGFAGLAPATSQAIGNSYAHPNIPAGKAFTTWERTFVEGQTNSMPFADHSYLANKALWDDFFFSSITPQRLEVQMFGNSTRDAKTVAKEFFRIGNSTAAVPLPNRRIQAYTNGLDEDKFDDLFDNSDPNSSANLFANGLADKIAAHLMVKGAFNINSTSEEAWKALFSSLKGKPVAYLDKNNALSGVVNLSEDEPDGVPVSSGGVPNAQSYTGSPSSPADPDQWIGWRELTNDEIKELAKAMVRQVKLRGPFLSLSEFVNRRLDSSNPDLSVKGALQAAIDDPAIPSGMAINRGFANRKFTDLQKAFVKPESSPAAFPEALDGPIAYGSTAYVDQADILRNMAEQLTPRGDTFVIRTYGDSLDTNGKVVARAWCEAVVQRVPDYVDSADENHIKQASLTSDSNKKFGRKFNTVSFRWLNPSEI